MTRIQLEISPTLAPDAGSRAQRRRDLAAARGAGGIAMLLTGGNAVDAALATAIALTVVEPAGTASAATRSRSCGTETTAGLNASGRAPRAWTPERFAGRDRMPTEGWDSVTVPGAVSAWAALSAKFGRLPFEDLFEPAIDYAARRLPGVAGRRRQWADARSAASRSCRASPRPSCRGGRPPHAGELFRLPAQARTLAGDRRTRGESFYRGALAQRLPRQPRTRRLR